MARINYEVVSGCLSYPILLVFLRHKMYRLIILLVVVVFTISSPTAGFDNNIALHKNEVTTCI